MDRRGLFFIVGGLSAFLLYALMFIIFFYYFNEHKSVKRFVPKNTNSLEISILQTPSQKKAHKKRGSTVKKSTKTSLPLRPKKSAVNGSTSAKHSSTSKSIATLFKGVKVDKPQFSSSLRMANAPKIKYKPTSTSKKQLEAKSLIDNLKFSNLDIKLKSQSSGSGSVDEYMSKIYEVIFNSWHPDALFAGLQAKVLIEIYPNGTFKYRMINPSDNQSFNDSLIEYLNQLQHKRFPPHKNGRKLVVELNFKPKE